MLLTEGLDIGLATVYRVLTQFEQAGLLVRHHFESGKAVFELNEGKHHDHLVCMQCGRVEEFYDAEIEKRQMKVAKRARLRDQRARALPVRRLHEAALPASQDRRSELTRVTPRRGRLRFRRRRRRRRPAASTASRRLKSASAKPQRVQRPEIDDRAAGDDEREAADLAARRRPSATSRRRPSPAHSTSPARTDGDGDLARGTRSQPGCGR